MTAQIHTQGLVLDTPQSTLWLPRLQAELDFINLNQAYRALGAVLHTLRDLLTPRQAKRFGTQLPGPIRMLFFENWHASGTPGPMRNREEFLERVAEKLPFPFIRDPLIITEAVFELLCDELDSDETARLVAALPVCVGELWPEKAQLFSRA